MNIYACSVCFLGSPEDPMNISLRAAIVCMLGILVVVLGLFASFFLKVRRRSKLISENH